MIRSTTTARHQPRRWLAAISGLCLVVTACGSDAVDTGSTTAETTATSTASSEAMGTTASSGSTANPTAPAEGSIEIVHKFGTTVLDGVPERVVTVETGKEEYVLALGVVPVGAIRSTFADFENGLSPWAIEAIGDKPMPQLLSIADGLPFEAIAALEPDLILGTEGLNEADYETLAAIAPTVAQSADFDDYTSPWDVQARLVAQAFGKEDEMDGLIADIEAGFDTAISDHPEFDGATAVFAGDFGDGNVYVFADYRGDFFKRLGMELPSAVTDEVLSNAVSNEQLDLLQADALLVALYAGDAASVADLPAFTSLPAFATGNVLLIEGNVPVLSALNFSTPLSLPVALEELVPALAALIDGDPATAPPAFTPA